MTAEIECKKIFVKRCLHAVLLNVGLQFLLLAVFLLFVNISLFHPIKWITETISLVFSFYTWFCIIPLIGITVVHGIILGNSYLAAKKYYSTRFQWIYGTGFRKLIFLNICVIIGFLTAWLYSRFLNEKYKLIFIEYFDQKCINSYFIFLALSGIYSGVYFFFKERLFYEPELKFPIIQECKYIKIRSSFYSTLLKCLTKAFFPTIWFMIAFWLFGTNISKQLAYTFNVDKSDDLNSIYKIITNICLILYSWILSSQILCNLHLTDEFFNILMTESLEFEIEKKTMLADCLQAQSDVTLVETLSLNKLPLAQYLACLDLYTISISNSCTRREKFFSLSIPGGHPYNWNQLSGQCLSILNEFHNNISEAIKNLSKPIEQDTTSNNCPKLIPRPTATDVAEKILVKQYNETLLIRNMINQRKGIVDANSIQSQDHIELNENNEICNRINAISDQMIKSMNEFFWAAFRTVPGLYYLFGKQGDTELTHILSQSKHINWIIQALVNICEKSLSEDKYGVTQTELPRIIKIILNLKITLDKLNTLNYNGKKIDRNLIALKNVIKRNLYRICTVFDNYMEDIIDDPDDLRLIMCFINYQEM